MQTKHFTFEQYFVNNAVQLRLYTQNLFLNDFFNKLVTYYQNTLTSLKLLKILIALKRYKLRRIKLNFKEEFLRHDKYTEKNPKIK